MTATQQNTDKAVNKLAKSLDGTNAQKATAIAAFVDGRIDKALEGLTPLVRDIVQQHRSTVEQVNGIPAEQRDPEVVEKVKEASDQVKPVANQANQLLARRKAGEEVTSEEISKVAEDAEEAKGVVEEAGSLLATQLRKLQTQVNEHEQVLALKSNGSRPKSRLDNMEHNITSMKADIDQLMAGEGEVQTVSATAFASAQANSQSYAWQRAGRGALIAFAATFVIYILLVMGPVNWDWNWAIGLPAVTAGIVGALIFALSREEGPSAEAVANANAITARWSKREQHRDEQEERPSPTVSQTEVDGVRSPLPMSRAAQAHASTRVG